MRKASALSRSRTRTSTIGSKPKNGRRRAKCYNTLPVAGSRSSGGDGAIPSSGPSQPASTPFPPYIHLQNPCPFRNHHHPHPPSALPLPRFQFTLRRFQSHPLPRTPNSSLHFSSSQPFQSVSVSPTTRFRIKSPSPPPSRRPYIITL